MANKNKLTEFKCRTLRSVLSKMTGAIYGITMANVYPCFVVEFPQWKFTVELTYEDFDPMWPVEVMAFSNVPEDAYIRAFDLPDSIAYHVRFGYTKAMTDERGIYYYALRALFHMIIMECTISSTINRAMEDALTIAWLKEVEHLQLNDTDVKVNTMAESVNLRMKTIPFPIYVRDDVRNPVRIAIAEMVESRYQLASVLIQHANMMYSSNRDYGDHRFIQTLKSIRYYYYKRGELETRNAIIPDVE